MRSTTFELLPIDNQRLAQLCGHCDVNLQQLEQLLQVKIQNRAHHFQLQGTAEARKLAARALHDLYAATAESPLNPEQIHLHVQQIKTHVDLPDTEATAVLNLRRCGTIKTRSPNQAHYVKNILTHAINFGIGPAGTGKTYLAVACAVAALEQEQVSRLILVRPAVEAGEKLGFLPGDFAQKVDPYFRPLYDALYEMLGVDEVTRLIERHIIEIAPLAYMRGRTLNDAFIILDESQNTTREQMKMFLTRIGFNSKVVVTGDITQTDLPKSVESGLAHCLAILKEVAGLSFNYFALGDIVRHPLVQGILQAYADYDVQSH